MAAVFAALDLDSSLLVEAFPPVTGLFQHVIYRFSIRFRVTEAHQGHQSRDAEMEAGAISLLFNVISKYEIKFKGGHNCFCVITSDKKGGTLYLCFPCFPLSYCMFL